MSLLIDENCSTGSPLGILLGEREEEAVKNSPTGL
jgi:hypothetical protein